MREDVEPADVIADEDAAAGRQILLAVQHHLHAGGGSDSARPAHHLPLVDAAESHRHPHQSRDDDDERRPDGAQRHRDDRDESPHQPER